MKYHPIKLIVQEGPECELCTMAMLANKPIELIRRRACDKVQISAWRRDAGRTSTNFWIAADHVIRFYDLQDQMFFGKDYLYLDSFPNQLVQVNDCAVRLHNLNIKTKLIGRAQVIVRGPFGAHSVVVDNGIIYDSDHPGRVPIPWVEYMRMAYYKDYREFCTLAKVEAL